MTLDELCAETERLTPCAARMAIVMLPLAGALPSFWHAELVGALLLVARRVGPLSAVEIGDVLHAAIHPVDRADWLRNSDEFAAAHRFAVNTHLAAEKWKSIVMTLLAYGENARH